MGDNGTSEQLKNGINVSLAQQTCSQPNLYLLLQIQFNRSVSSVFNTLCQMKLNEFLSVRWHTNKKQSQMNH